MKIHGLYEPWIFYKGQSRTPVPTYLCFYYIIIVPSNTDSTEPVSVTLPSL